MTQTDDVEIAAAKRVFPIGRPVTFTPVIGRPEREETAIRSEPWKTGSGAILVMVEGRSGGVSIDHLALT